MSNRFIGAFGKNLRRLRTERSISQREVADAVGVQQAHIASIESGDRLPSLPLAMAIAEFMEVSLDSLMYSHETAEPAADAA